MSEQQGENDASSSEAAAAKSATTTTTTTTRFRSRFPKAMPNLGPRNTGTTQSTAATLPAAEKPSTDEERPPAVSAISNSEKESSRSEENVATTATVSTPSVIISTPESPKKQVSINTDSVQAAGGARVRNRFPRAQPNLALSSGLERMRRLSGHYHSEQQQQSPLTSGSGTSLADCSAAQHLRTPPHTPQPQQQHIDQVAGSPLSRQNSISHAMQQQQQHSPMKQRTLSVSDSPGVSSSLSLRQAFASSPLAHSVGAHSTSSLVISQPSTPYTPLHSVYSSKFPKEQIKNFIKHIAMQKLKKFEADSLKEKRKTYKKKFDSAKSSKQPSNEDASTMEAAEAASFLAAESAPSPSAIDRSKLCMRDFLYYSPRVKKNEEIVMDLSQPGTPTSSQQAEILDETSNHSTTTSVSSVSSARTNESISSRPPTGDHIEAAAAKRVTFAPQLKIAEDGSIIINEESLVVQRENIEPDRTYDTVVETEPSDSLTYNSYRKHHHTRKWTERETTKFYKALSMIGTDFTMIQKLFPNRSRDEIKRKFKREEKLNQALIDKILSKTDQIELSVFVSGSEDDDAESTTTTTSNKKSESSKRRKLKEKNENDSSLVAAGGSATPTTDETNKNNEKKSKLKRIRKRQFVESSDSEGERGTKKKSHKSKEFINDSDDNSTIKSSSSSTTLPKLPTLVSSQSGGGMSSIRQEEKLPSISSLYQNSLIPIREHLCLVKETSTSSPLTVIQEAANEKIDQEEEEEEEELVLDLDTNSIRLASENSGSSKPTSISKDDEDEHIVIFDMDNNTFIKQQQPTLSTDQTSSITITRSSSKTTSD